MNYVFSPTARVTIQSAYAVLDPLLEALLERLRDAWQTHLRLLADNTRYAAAFAAGASALMGQGSPLDLIATIAAVLLAIHTATRRIANLP